MACAVDSGRAGLVGREKDWTACLGDALISHVECTLRTPALILCSSDILVSPPRILYVVCDRLVYCQWGFIFQLLLAEGNGISRHTQTACLRPFSGWFTSLSGALRGRIRVSRCSYRKTGVLGQFSLFRVLLLHCYHRKRKQAQK